jgi:hypothetical protein
MVESAMDEARKARAVEPRSARGIEEACAAQDWRASKELNEKGMAPS